LPDMEGRAGRLGRDRYLGAFMRPGRSVAAVWLAIVLSLGSVGSGVAADPVVGSDPVVITDPIIPVVATDRVFPRSPAPALAGLPARRVVETMGVDRRNLRRVAARSFIRVPYQPSRRPAGRMSPHTQRPWLSRSEL
jgi:hypothetical protein